MTRNRRAPAAGTARGSKVQTLGRGLHTSKLTGAGIVVHDPVAELILPRLDRVQRAGSGYTARCPAHEDRTASLSVGVGREGQALVHCFAGCSVADALGAIGLELADLYPRQPRDLSPMARAERRQAVQAGHVLAAARVLAREARIVEVAAYLLETGAGLAPDDHHRLVEARLRTEAAALALEAAA
jgi:predicted protein tyrosine phosphatase